MEIHDAAVLGKIGKISQTKVKADRRPQKASLKAGELSLFTKTLSELLQGGVPILKALEGLEKVAHNDRLKGMLAGVLENIRRGSSLSDSLEKSGVIPAFVHQAVYAGEISGRVPMVLSELATYLDKENTLKRSIRDALVYPAFIVAVGFATLAVLICYVLPKLKGVYEGFGSELPLITTLILGLSKIFVPASCMLAVLGFFLVSVLRKKKDVGVLLNKIPFVGDFFNGFLRVRFSRLLSLLLESGIPVLQALEVAERTFGDHPLKDDIVAMKTSLAEGGGFSQCLDQVVWMDPVSRMLAASGEQTGRIGASFLQIARDTETVLEARIHLAVKLLEPGLILVIGLSVGFVVIGTVLPIFDMSGVVR